VSAKATLRSGFLTIELQAGQAEPALDDRL
jgi:hypothetical protein